MMISKLFGIGVKCGCILQSKNKSVVFEYDVFSK